MRYVRLVIGARTCSLAVCALMPAVGVGQTLTLEAAIEAATVRSLKVASQSHAAQGAAAIVQRASELPDPKLRFGIENLPVTDAERFRYDRDFMTMQRIGVVQELPHSAKRAAARARAQSEVAVERASLMRERVAVRRETAVVWMEYVYAKALHAQLDALHDQVDLEVQASAPALAAGRTTTADVFALRGVREVLRDRAIIQDRMVQRARLDLARLIGAAVSNLPGPVPDTTVPPYSHAEITRRLERHPAIVTARAQTRMAQAEVNKARASSAPDWMVELSVARREPAFSNMVSLMVQMDLPLWTERRQDRDVAARVAALERARTLTEDARRSAEAELLLYLTDHDAAQQRLRHFQQGLLATARQRTVATLAAYQGGRGTLAAVLEARRAEGEITIDQLGAERERALAWASLRYALLDEDEQGVLERED